MRHPNSLVVSEVFGPTFQGEGPSTGRRASFIRLGGCNLACVWCDTPYTWDWSKYDPQEEMTLMSFSHLAEKVVSQGAPLLVITGGEPMLQWDRVKAFLRYLEGRQITPSRIEIETAGTIPPDKIGEISRLFFNISPKLTHSGNALDKRYKPQVLRAFNRLNHDQVIFKFVVRADHCDHDLAEIGVMCQQVGIPPGKVWIMPEGITEKAVQQGVAEIAEQALIRGYNLSGRLQVEIWGNRRGV